MRVIAFHPKHNAEGRRDVSGAFRPECLEFMKIHGRSKEDIYIIDNSRPLWARANQVLKILKQHEGKYLEAVAFFCHGWQTGMQLGFRKNNVDKLAKAIYKTCQSSVMDVPLYLCSTGGGTGSGATSFADALRDALCVEGAAFCRVMAHSTVAHTTKNPDALFFEGMGSPVGGIGGYEVVKRGTELWTPWRKALQGKESKNKDFRFRFAFMTIAEIHAELKDTSATIPPVVVPPVGADIYKVIDELALIRSGPPRYKSTGQTIPVGTFVRINKSSANGKYVRVTCIDGKHYKWTVRSNLANEPERPIEIPIPSEIESPDAPLIAPQEDIFTVIDKKALIRKGAPSFGSIGKKIPRYTRVRVLNSLGDYVRVIGLDGNDYQWTAKSNLILYYKDSVRLARIALPPKELLIIEPGWSGDKKLLGQTFNRLGGLIVQLAGELNVHPAGVLAVWMVESSGHRHVENQVLIRFENHHLFRYWGEKHPGAFNSHYQFGDHNNTPGPKWKNHKYRVGTSGPFRSFHGKQAQEYKVLELATKHASEEIAIKCISMGGPQILGSHYRRLGYASPKEMFDAFQANERAHVLGFFDYCNGDPPNGAMIKRLSKKKWIDFAMGYNGKGKAEKYGSKIKNAFKTGKSILT
ncbi:MAG: N-acetylmuramidase family protein [Proteobacteria bacterium]|nr:N-acetylmuramidase family protein [Pseudomonadota bacterium]